MEWYCALWNSDKATFSAGAEYIYELLCQGDSSLVSEFPVVEECYQEVLEKYPWVTCHRLEGALIMSCDFSRAEELYIVGEEVAKRHGLAFYEPQNFTFIPQIK